MAGDVPLSASHPIMGPSGGPSRTRDRSPKSPDRPRPPMYPRRRLISSSITRELDSIRARRAKLEALTASIRLPPLISSDVMGPYSPSVLHHPPRTYTGPRHVHRVRIGDATLTPGTPGSAISRPVSNRLPPLATPPRTAIHNPLPDIGQIQKPPEDLETGENDVGEMVDEAPSPESTPSPVVSPMSREIPPGSGKRHSPILTPTPVQDDIRSSKSVQPSEVLEHEQIDEEGRKKIKAIVLEMAGGVLPDSTTTNTTDTITNTTDTDNINTTNTNTTENTDNTTTETTNTPTTVPTNTSTTVPTDTTTDDTNNITTNTTNFDTGSTVAFISALDIRKASNDTDIVPTSPTVHNDTTTASKLKSTVSARILLSQERTPPVDDFIEAGILQVVDHNLKHCVNTDLLFETAWVVTNIASGTSNQTRAVADAGLIEPLVHLVEDGEPRLKDQATWALANIAADSEELRNAVVEAGFFKPLIAFIREKVSIAALRNSTWALSNIFRLRRFMLEEENIRLAVDVLKDVCLASKDSEVIKDGLWCLKYMTQHDNMPIQCVVDAGIVPVIIPYMKGEEDCNASFVSIGIIGNIVSGTDIQTDAVLEAGVIPILHEILKTSIRVRTRKEVAWSLSNITAGTSTQIQKLLDDGLLPTLIDIMRNDEFDVMKEATWAISNTAVGGSEQQVGVLVQHDVVHELLGIVKNKPETIISYLIPTTLSAMMEHEQHVDTIKDQIEACNGVNTLLEIKQSSVMEASEAAEKLFKKHFPDRNNDGDGDDEADVGSLTETASKYMPDE